MKLTELLAADRIVIPLPAATLLEAAAQLTETLIAAGTTEVPERLRELLKEGLTYDSIAIDNAVLLHHRTVAVSELSIALGVAADPVQLDEDPDATARIVMLIVAPPKDTSAYLRAVSAFSRVLSREAVVDAILGAKSPEYVLKGGPLADIELPGYLTVRDVMVPRRLSVRSDTTLGEASKLMVSRNVPALPVVSETNEVLGMVSHRELLRYLLPTYVKRMTGAEFRSVGRGGEGVVDPHDIPVREVMDRSVLCVSEDQTLGEVATMMTNRNVDRFPVVREGALVGFLTRGDIVRRLLGP